MAYKREFNAERRAEAKSRAHIELTVKRLRSRRSKQRAVHARASRDDATSFLCSPHRSHAHSHPIAFLLRGDQNVILILQSCPRNSRDFCVVFIQLHERSMKCLPSSRKSQPTLQSRFVRPATEAESWKCAWITMQPDRHVSPALRHSLLRGGRRRQCTTSALTVPNFPSSRQLNVYEFLTTPTLLALITLPLRVNPFCCV